MLSYKYNLNIYQHVFNKKVEIWKANPRKKEDLWLFPGVHEYPFTYALPIDLPESMDDSGYASINYTIKVYILFKGRTLNLCSELFEHWNPF